MCHDDTIPRDVTYVAIIPRDVISSNNFGVEAVDGEKAIEEEVEG